MNNLPLKRSVWAVSALNTSKGCVVSRSFQFAEASVSASRSLARACLRKSKVIHHNRLTSWPMILGTGFKGAYWWESSGSSSMKLMSYSLFERRREYAFHTCTAKVRIVDEMLQLKPNVTALPTPDSRFSNIVDQRCQSNKNLRIAVSRGQSPSPPRICNEFARLALQVPSVCSWHSSGQGLADTFPLPKAAC